MEAILRRRKNALTAMYTTDSTAFNLYEESIGLQIGGHYRDAADKLVRSAELFQHIRLIMEAASIYTEAAECYLKVDKTDAVHAYAQSIKLYCEAGKFDIAGVLERKIANIHYRIHHYDDAALHYRKAANFLSGDKRIEQSDYCQEKSAECFVRIGEARQAHFMYESVAISCVNSNLRRLSVRGKLLRSIACLFGTIIPKEKEKPRGREFNYNEDRVTIMIPLTREELVQKYQEKYAEIEEKIRSYEDIDYLWRGSKHKLLASNLLKFRLDLDLDNFVDHLYFWNNISQWDSPFLTLWQVPVQEIQYEIGLLRKPVSKEGARALNIKSLIAKPTTKGQADEVEDEMDENQG